MKGVGADHPGPKDGDLEAAALAIARGLASGGTLWCAVPGSLAAGEKMAAELRRPAVSGGSSLRVVALGTGDLTDTLRALVRAGDSLLLATDADDASARGLRERAAAWGLLTVWVGAGPRPETGAADYVLFDAVNASSDTDWLFALCRRLSAVIWDRLGADELLAAMPGACAGEVCITCSDEGRLGEVSAVGEWFQAEVRTASGVETVDTSLIEDVRRGDVLLIHAGSALQVVLRDASARHEEPTVAAMRAATGPDSHQVEEAP